MKKYIIITALSVFTPMALSAQLKLSNTMAKSALNSNVTETIVIASVKNTQSSYGNNVTDYVSSSYSAAYSGSPSVVLTNTVNPISSRFGYYTPYYAEVITVYVYSAFYHNIPLLKYLPPSGEYYLGNPTVAMSILNNRILPAYRYFSDNKPGYVPYVYEKPASVSIDVGVSKPIPLQVDPANQAYWLYNTRFVRTFSLTY